MVSKDQRKRESLQEKLQQLRSATHSTSTDAASIIDDASKYIEELMERVEKLNLEIMSDDAPSSSSEQDPSSMLQVAVKTITSGFQINVYSKKNHQRLLVSVMDAFDDLGLDILNATITCSEDFHLEAVGGKNQMHVSENITEEMVRTALLQATMKTLKN